MAIIGISGKIGSGKDLTGQIIQYLTSKSSKSKTFDQYLEGASNNKWSIFHFPIYKSNWEVRKFGTKLKQMVCLLTGCTMEQLEDQAFKNTYLSEEWNYVFKGTFKGIHSKQSVDVFKDDSIFKADPQRFIKRYTYRELLQLLGTEALRNIIHEDAHVNALFADYIDNIHLSKILAARPNKNISESNWIITDTRFINEAKAIKYRNGILIRVERPIKYWLDRKDYEAFTGKEVPQAKEHLSEIALDGYNGFNYILLNDGTIEDLVEKVRKILILEKIIQ